MPKSRLNLLFLFFQLLTLQFLSIISAIRKDIGFQETPFCKTTVQGRYLLSDDNGYVCDAVSMDPQSRCCPEKGEKFSCQGCNLLSQCCNSYEYCVSCCVNPARTLKEQVLNVKIAKPTTAGTYGSVFDFCAGRCRHNSESVVHENAYLSDFHHCFSMPSNASGAGVTQLEGRLSGISVIIGRLGESCDSVCKSSGQSCVLNKLILLNQCEIIQKYMSCKRGCLASMGADQPAEVADDAPSNLNPTACLYTRIQSMLSCDGSHRHTRRLCPCA
ncbi:glycosyltransferase family protein [Citrus sinensis]|uniref:uncharacterized protein LOC102616686 isoform X1 n=1 Tax=Citrus sinensis TaxID=2711 RepID=UPI00219D1265|nr:uncharacterized protein LOC102616686 isoform X1 [Citrus sinensis]XP_006478692.2 uncharacterized protein LOC102616686 isoform X1 [Citrus sinensis]XP_052294510.1 uncharacterized protein LOC102616686 isoform X1 [Citrus sinensis]XP_052294511.1 uncharacterized protein LOC102616686 isoform X1 [Citrus sinensis]XP_052294512.1 uncharacterized protein LOC102616686 isoform X1 [Citrus sinensis]XP_052294513.1 uncharacterized protein LOC102616686 isoform X1 [Citrus sinensis]KAH9727637.1 glycosyltransfer